MVKILGFNYFEVFHEDVEKRGVIISLYTTWQELKVHRNLFVTKDTMKRLSNHSGKKLLKKHFLT